MLQSNSLSNDCSSYHWDYRDRNLSHQTFVNHIYYRCSLRNNFKTIHRWRTVIIVIITYDYDDYDTYIQ